MKTMIQSTAVALALSMLSACGGGSGNILDKATRIEGPIEFGEPRAPNISLHATLQGAHEAALSWSQDQYPIETAADVNGVVYYLHYNVYQPDAPVIQTRNTVALIDGLAAATTYCYRVESVYLDKLGAEWAKLESSDFACVTTPAGG